MRALIFFSRKIVAPVTFKDELCSYAIAFTACVPCHKNRRFFVDVDGSACKRARRPNQRFGRTSRQTGKRGANKDVNDGLWSFKKVEE